ncbi:MAG: hypothetical protein ACKORE_00265 [Bacteroidota bacterium]
MSESEILERNAGQCLSEGEMIAYLGTSLSAKARHTLELHLSECPFCSDALDGLKLLPSNRDLHRILQELTLPEHPQSTESTTRIRILFPWRIAAAFLLVGLSIATLFLLKPDTDSGIAEAPYSQSDQLDEPLLPTPTNEHDQSQKAATPQAENESPRMKSHVSTEALDQVIPESDAGDITEYTKALSEEPAPPRADESEVALTSPMTENNRETTSDVQTGSVQREEDDARSVQVKETLASATTKSASPSPGQKDYEKGVRAYGSGQYTRCIELLSRKEVLRDPLIREEALWTLAQCQLNAGDTAAARSSLTQLIRINGRHLNGAKRQLEILK